MLKIPGVLTSLFSRPPRSTGAWTREDQEALAAIEQWTSPLAAEVAHKASVHIVVGAGTWRFAAWTLASWLHFTESGWSIRLHDDGTLPDDAAGVLKNLFPAARLISRREADAALKPVLTAFPFCETLRDDDPSALRIFDALHFATADHCISLESHVLFFKYPREVITWADGSGAGCWFNHDEAEHSLVSPEEAMDELKVTIREHVGDSLWLLSRPAFDLDFMDSALAQTKILRGALDDSTRTLAMLCASRAGSGHLLPLTYDVAGSRKLTDEEVCRQYPPNTRSRFAEEGIKRVRAHLFAPVDA